MRRLAIRALAAQRKLDNVPTFIAGLSADDTSVIRESRDALRLVSRKFGGFSLPNNPTDKQLNDATEAWKKWYLEIRPGAALLD